MARLVHGHDAALNALMERHGEKVFHYLIRQLQSEADAADLAQETFVRVYQNRARFDPAARFSTWLYTIATNLVRDRFRWRGRHPQVALQAEIESSGGTLGDSLADDNPGPDQQMQNAERADVVRRAVARLPEDLRTAIILSEYERTFLCGDRRHLGLLRQGGGRQDCSCATVVALAPRRPGGFLLTRPAIPEWFGAGRVQQGARRSFRAKSFPPCARWPPASPASEPPDPANR